MPDDQDEPKLTQGPVDQVDKDAEGPADTAELYQQPAAVDGAITRARDLRGPDCDRPADVVRRRPAGCRPPIVVASS